MQNLLPEFQTANLGSFEKSERRESQFSLEECMMHKNTMLQGGVVRKSHPKSLERLVL